MVYILMIIGLFSFDLLRVLFLFLFDILEYTMILKFEKKNQNQD